ncbi:hypothetical protein CBL_08192 [Carabus blaptoides fortunei]
MWSSLNQCFLLKQEFVRKVSICTVLQNVQIILMEIQPRVQLDSEPGRTGTRFKRKEEVATTETIVPGAPSCKWIGPRGDVRVHCETKHPGKVLQNPGCLKNNFTKNTIQTFLMSAFTVIFLIHTKMCLTRKKIMISVSQLGDAENGSFFSFQLDITKNKEKITKLGSVIAPGVVTELVPETSVTSIHVNSLVDIFGNLDGVTFNITIHSKCANNCMSGLEQVLQSAKLILQDIQPHRHTDDSNMLNELLKSRCSSILFIAFEPNKGISGKPRENEEDENENFTV